MAELTPPVPAESLKYEEGDLGYDLEDNQTKDVFSNLADRAEQTRDLVTMQALHDAPQQFALVVIALLGKMEEDLKFLRKAARTTLIRVEKAQEEQDALFDSIDMEEEDV